MKYSKILFSLNKFIGISCESVNDADLVFGTNQVGDIDQFKNGNYELFVYKKGELADYRVNSWTFSCNAKGQFHVPGYQQSVFIEVEACAPNGQTERFSTYTSDTYRYETEAASLYMSVVMVVSLCDSIYDAHVLFKALNEGLNKNRIEDSLENLKVINKILKNAKDNDEIPKEWIQHAESKYRLMHDTFVESIDKEKLIKLILE